MSSVLALQNKTVFPPGQCSVLDLVSCIPLTCVSVPATDREADTINQSLPDKDGHLGSLSPSLSVLLSSLNHSDNVAINGEGRQNK